MGTKQIAELFLKYLGVQQVLSSLWGTHWIVMFIYWFTATADDPYRSRMLSAVQPSSIFSLLCGLVLILCAGRIAGWLVKRRASDFEDPSGFRLLSSKGFRFCLMLLGMMLLFSALTFLGSGLTLQPAGPASLSLAVGYEWGRCLGLILPVAFGLYLVFGGGWMTRFASGKRSALPA